MHQGSIAIISNHSCTEWLIQRKDGAYPLQEQRRTICFFGGSVEAGESPLEAVLRELEEEIVYEPFLYAASLKLNAGYFNEKKYILPSQKNPGTKYELNAFRFVVPDETLNELKSVIYKPGVVTEGYAEIVSTEYLKYILLDHPYDMFSTLAIVLRDLIDT